MTYRVLTLGDPRQVAVRPIEGWEFHGVPPSVGPPNVCNLPPHRGIANSVFADYIATLRPDFVIVLCEGCTERRLERTGFPKGPRYVTWSTDSYRHTVRVTASDLHLTAIPDEAMRPGDHFLPLFAGPRRLVPLHRRTVRCGIVYRSYDLQGSHRESEIADAAAVLPDLVREHRLSEAEYDERVLDFGFGLNVAVYPDALPNFRSFELGRSGVMPISNARQRPLLEQLFGEHVRLYERVEDIPRLLEAPYDELALKAFYDEHHSYEARLRQLFARYFDLDL